MDKINLEKRIDIADKIDELYYLYLTIQSRLENYVANDMNKLQTWILGLGFSKIFNLPEAYNLLKIALEQKYHNFLYVRKNGKWYKSLYDLDDNDLKIDIAKRVEKEYPNTDVPVFITKSDSSLSKKISKSNTLKFF